MSDERVTEALNALRRADLDIETGPDAEIRVLLAFRRRRRRFQRVVFANAIAAAVLIFALLRSSAGKWPVPKPSPSIATLETPARPEALEIPEPAEAEEIATPFFPLMVSPPPLERALLVRVTVRASAMRSVGLNVGDEHLSDLVQADVLVGQDDLARAIRFVSYRK